MSKKIWLVCQEGYYPKIAFNRKEDAICYIRNTMLQETEDSIYLSEEQNKEYIKQVMQLQPKHRNDNYYSMGDHEIYEVEII